MSLDPKDLEPLFDKHEPAMALRYRDDESNTDVIANAINPIIRLQRAVRKLQRGNAMARQQKSQHETKLGLTKCLHRHMGGARHGHDMADTLQYKRRWKKKQHHGVGMSAPLGKPYMPKSLQQGMDNSEHGFDKRAEIMTRHVNSALWTARHRGAQLHGGDSDSEEDIAAAGGSGSGASNQQAGSGPGIDGTSIVKSHRVIRPVVTVRKALAAPGAIVRPAASVGGESWKHLDWNTSMSGKAHMNGDRVLYRVEVPASVAGSAIQFHVNVTRGRIGKLCVHASMRHSNPRAAACDITTSTMLSPPAFTGPRYLMHRDKKDTKKQKLVAESPGNGTSSHGALAAAHGHGADSDSMARLGLAHHRGDRDGELPLAMVADTNTDTVVTPSHAATDTVVTPSHAATGQPLEGLDPGLDNLNSATGSHGVQHSVHNSERPGSEHRGGGSSFGRYSCESASA